MNFSNTASSISDKRIQNNGKHPLVKPSPLFYACIQRALLAVCLTAGAVWAQTPEAAPATPPVPDMTTPMSDADLTPATLEALKQNAASLSGLDDAQRAALLEQYDEALRQLQLSEDWRNKAMQFEQWRVDAPEETKRLQDILAQPPPETAPQISEQTTLAELEQQLAASEANYKSIQVEFDDLMREPSRRADRRREIPDLLAAAKQRLQEAQSQWAAPPSSDDFAELAAARRIAAQSKSQAVVREIASLRIENQAYDANTSNVDLRQEEAKRRLTAAEKEYKALQEATAARRSAEAAKAAEEARRVLKEMTEADPLIRDKAMQLAEENSILAEKRTGQEGLTNRIETATSTLAQMQSQLKKVEEDYDRVMQRVKMGGLNSAVAALLREQRTQLPSARELDSDINTYRATITEIELAQNELRERRLLLSDVEQELQQAIKSLPKRYTDHERNTIQKIVMELLQKQRSLIDSLQRDYDTYLNLVFDLSTQQQQLAAQSRRFTSYINEHVLWIGGAPIGLNTLKDTAAAAQWLGEPQAWRDAPERFLNHLLDYVASYGALAFMLLAAMALYRYIRARIRRLGAEVAKPRDTHFWHSFEALLLTVFLSILWPAWFGLLGWILISVEPASDQVRAVGQGLLAIAVLSWSIEILRQLLTASGVGECHFGWPSERVKAARRHLTRFELLVLPLIGMIFTYENQPDDSRKDAIGRLAFIGAMLLLALLLRRLIRQIQLGLQEMRRNTWFTERQSWRFIAKAVIIGLPLALAMLAVAGFYFTALHLAYRLFWALMLLLAIGVTTGMIRRWFLLTKRRLAIQQAQRRREAAKAEAQKADSPPATLDASLFDEELDLVKVDAQTQSLLRIGAAFTFLLGSWFIWADVVPALNMLDNIHLWPTTVDVQQEIQNDKGETEIVVVQKPGWITASNLGLSVLVAFLTIASVRNLPGLLEILLLQRLKMGAGERYATLAITRYLLIGLGIILAFGAIGVGWSKVQWLVAALGVGLGFGLQEIFANFISGLILLFERPMRVGDTVTIGDVSGTVAQIRIRATTITNWDRKELVVPNKEFITGKLINWTLSDNVLRLVIPVGIAYGSDTQKTIEILSRLAQDHPKVLADPAPIAVFVGFGDSTLNFDLRVFVPSPDFYLSVRHDLLVAIDRAFQEANITLAFPQRDLHIRSGLEPLLAAAQRPPQENPGRDEIPL